MTETGKVLAALQSMKETHTMSAKKLKLVWPGYHKDLDIISPPTLVDGLLIVHLEHSPYAIEAVEDIQYETVEVVRWLCKHGHIQWNGSDTTRSDTAAPKICTYSDEDYHCNSKEFIKFTAQVPIPVKPKVRRREEISTCTFANDVFKTRGITNGKAFIEWEE